MKNINVSDENSFEVRYLYLRLALKKQFSVITIFTLSNSEGEKKVCACGRLLLDKRWWENDMPWRVVANLFKVYISAIIMKKNFFLAKPSSVPSRKPTIQKANTKEKKEH